MKKPATFTPFFLLLPLLLTAQTTLYVNQNVSGGLQNGSTWADAFPDLQQALAVAQAGDAVWVAQGTYYPTKDADRLVSFVLNRGVKLYGGFVGTETALQQRDYAQYRSILSGDIGQPGVGADNSRHVLYGVVGGNHTDTTTLLDGLVVTQGVAEGNETSGPEARGGGLYLYTGGSPVIQNCVFERNYAFDGGAIYCANTMNPILRNCRFESNRAVSGGGAVYKTGMAPPNRPFLVENCVFRKNAVTGYLNGGGAVFLTKTGRSVEFRECRFEEDSTVWKGYGAGVYIQNNGTTNAFANSFLMDNCVFERCWSYTSGGAFYIGTRNSSAVDVFFQMNCIIKDCVFNENITYDGDGPAWGIQGDYRSKLQLSVQSCIFTNNQSGGDGTAKMSGASKESECEMRFTNCLFFNNKRRNNPDAYCAAIYGGLSSPGTFKTRIQNCVFAHNGGGVNCLNDEGGMTTEIDHCTFYQNGRRMIVNKSWYPNFNGTDFYNDCYINNCIFEEVSEIDRMFLCNDFQNVNVRDFHIDYSMVSLYDNAVPGGVEAFGDHVQFRGDPMFVDAPNGNFRLKPKSPAVNAGNNAVVDTLLVKDLDGLPRIQCDTVDMGAYELQDSCATTSSLWPLAAQPLQLSPNPSTGLLQLDISEPGTLSLFDAQGRLVQSQAEVQPGGAALRLDHLAPGLYRVQVETKRGVFEGRWVKM